jgi:thymidylate kinase
MPAPLIDGVLLEGLNYSGKTTVARAVEQELKAREAQVRYGRCYLCDEPIVEALQKLSFNGLVAEDANGFPDPRLMKPFNAFRSAQIIADSQFASERRWPGLLVQDRQWYSQLCNNEFFTPGESFLSAEWIEHSAPRFTVQLYLTCSPQVRLERVKKRPERESHAFNTYLRANVESFPSFDEACLELVDRYGGFEVINTDGLDVGAFAREVADRVYGSSNAAAADTAAGMGRAR